MPNRIVTGLLVLALGLPVQAVGSRAPQGSPTDVQEGIQKVREADFEGGARMLEAARARLIERQAAIELSQVDVYLSVAYFETSRTDLARARLDEAWAWNRKLTISATDFAPRFIAFFEQVRAEIDARNRKKSALKKWIILIPVVLVAVALGVNSAVSTK